MNTTRNRARALVAIALGVTAAGVGFVLRGGFGIGLFLALAAMEAALMLYLWPEAQAAIAARPPAVRASRRLLIIALAAVILLLAATYVVFQSNGLPILNFLTIFVLYAVQLILVSGSSAHDWDHPAFWLESALAYVVRPFISLAALPGMIRRGFGGDSAEPAADGGADTDAEGAAAAAGGRARRAGRLGQVGMVLLGILLAVPVLLIAGALLASADSVFGRFLESVAGVWQTLAFRETVFNIALTLFLFPFVFSFLESARSRWMAITSPHRPVPQPVDGTPDAQGTIGSRDMASAAGTAGAQVWRDPVAFVAMPGARRFAINPVMLVSFLASINLLYLIFAAVQLTYLTGAFQLSLPAGLTYADYARNGFFELAAMAPLNAALIMLAVKGAPRSGNSGRLLRIMGLLLVAGSFVQWGSAMFRMSMYVGAFGLTLLRFFVTAFMLLMAVVFILLIIKEFRPRLPLFKSVAVAAVLALILLNYVNADAWIARHNINRTLANPAVSLDVKNFRSLSPDAALILLDHLPQLQPAQRAEAAEFLFRKLESDGNESAYLNWQNYNWSAAKARSRLSDARTALLNELPPSFRR